MKLARRQFLAAGAALAAAGAARAQSGAVTPEQFGAVGDLDADAGTDDTAAFRRMAEYLSATGARARVTRRHRVTGGFALFAGTLEFADGALVRNTTRDERRVWPNTCLFVGTWFGVTAPSGLNARPQHAILPLAAGAERARFAGGRVPPGFAPGALVYFKDGRRYPGARHDLRIASHVSEIAAVERDAIVMRHPTPLAIGGTRDRYATALTPGDGLPLAPGLGVPAPRTRLARGVRIVNGAFESAQSAPGKSQTVHVACHDCDLDFRWLKGSDCLGINPCSDSRIAVRDAEFTSTLYELAYFHARVRGEVVRGRRAAGGKARGVAPVAITEYGHSVDLGLVDVTDAPVRGGRARPTVAIAAPLTAIGTLRVTDAAGVAVAIGAGGTRAEGTRIGTVAIDGAGQVGVRIESDAVEIGRAEVAGLRARRGVPVLLGRGAGPAVLIAEARFAPGQALRDLRPRADPASR